MHHGRHGMIWTPDTWHSPSAFLVELHYLYRVPSTRFDRSDVKPQYQLSLMSAPNMETVVAGGELACNGWEACFVAELARRLETFLWYETDTFCRVQVLCIAEADLLCPHCTIYVHPIVPGSALERLSRIDRATCS